MLGFNSLASVPLASVFVGVVIARTVTLTLVDAGGAPMANLSNLKWALFDAATPDLLAAPTASGVAASTNGSGVMVLTIPVTNVSVGGVGSFVVSTTDGTLGQTPSAKTFFGVVQVN
jgi:hypothetical protein